MSGPEDTGSNSVADAAAFEAWRERNYGDVPFVRQQRRIRRALGGGCTCHARSEEPCAWCSRDPEGP